MESKGYAVENALARRFFYLNAGYSYDPKTETEEQGRNICASQLARAEERGKALGFAYSWEPDTDPDLSWCECANGNVTHDHEVLGCVLRDSSGTVLASLWGITDPTRDYGRVVAAELASEALHEIDSQRFVTFLEIA